jgi:hypothetical protein
LQYKYSTAIICGASKNRKTKDKKCKEKILLENIGQVKINKAIHREKKARKDKLVQLMTTK